MATPNNENNKIQRGMPSANKPKTPSRISSDADKDKRDSLKKAAQIGRSQDK